MKRNTGVGDLFKVRLGKWCFPGGGGHLNIWDGYVPPDFFVPRSRIRPQTDTPF